MKAFWGPAQLQHAPEFFLQRGQLRRNFETPDRAEALIAACTSMGLEITLPPKADRSAILAIHDAGYLDFLRDGPSAWAQLSDHGPEMVPNIHPSPEMLANGARPSGTIIGQIGWYTADTSCPVSAATWPSALSAAEGAIAAADAIADEKYAYAVARPPGHHAYAARAGGHCYLNNAAIAAQRLISNGAAKVGVLDIDSHHGNGTQGIFWDRSEVLVASVHGDPNAYYPWYVGHADETGGYMAPYSNLNIPLASGSGDSLWLAAITHALQRIANFGADALVVSLGFDASEHEPLRFLSVTMDGFARAGRAIGHSGLPAVIIQEGGYNIESLGPLLEAFLDGLLNSGTTKPRKHWTSTMASE